MYKKIIVFVIGLLLLSQTAFGQCLVSLEHLVKWKPSNNMVGLYADIDGDGTADVIHYMNIEISYPIKCEDCVKETIIEFAEYYVFTTGMIPYGEDISKRTVIIAKKRGEELDVSEIPLAETYTDPVVYKVSKSCALSHVLTPDEKMSEIREEILLKPKEW